MAPLESTAAVDPRARRLWKGGVFATSDWVCVGESPSRVVSNHGRPVRLWAHKSWLAKNSVQGDTNVLSAFSVSKIAATFIHYNPSVPMSQCNWHLGTRSLSASVRALLGKDNMLYGAPVTLIPNGIGAVLMPATEAAKATVQ